MTRPDDATLLDLLVDGFEKNEVLSGFHHRELPMRDPEAAAVKFASLVDEAKQWKGQPVRFEETTARRLAAWDRMEIRQAGRGVMVRIRAAKFSDWWHDQTTWDGDVMGPIWQWMEEEGA